MDKYAILAELIRVSAGEALFRPSSIGRVIACPGSVRLIARVPRVQRRSSKYAEEGSGAHKVAEQALKGERQPEEWTDRMVQLDSGGMHGVFVTEEMVDAVNTYIDSVRSAAGEPGVELRIEEYMSLSALDPSDPIIAQNRGTGDAVILNRSKRRLGIKDLKYGKGVMVAGDSPQLKNYAILAALTFNDTQWDVVELEVNQPRALNESQRLKRFEFSPADLMMDFLGELMGAMHASLGDDPPLKTGSHCRWCAAKEAGICPAVQAEALAIGRDAISLMPPLAALASMGPIPDAVHLATIEAPLPEVRTDRTVILPPAVGLDPADIATILDRRHIYDMWIESVEMRAAALIESGVTVPGWMMSPRTGNRAWKEEEEETQKKLMALGLRVIEMYSVPKLLSPAQMEKKLKKDMRHLIADLVHRPELSPVLMRATEGRQPVAITGMGPIES